MGKILIYDPYSSGHHPVYVERFINNLSPYLNKHEITFAVHDKTIELLSEKAKDIAEELSCRFVDIDFDSYRRTRTIFGVSFAERRTLSKLLSQDNYELVILFYADHIVNNLGVFPLPRVKCVGLFFRAPILKDSGGPQLARAIESVKVRIRRFLLRSFLKKGAKNRGLFLDFRVTESRNGAFGLCPEPTVESHLTLEENDEIEERFPPDDTRITMLLAGGITERKGTLKFLSLLMRTASPSLAKIRLIIVGEIQDANEGRDIEVFVDKINGAGGFVVTDFTRTNEKTYSYLFEKTDIVVVPYTDHFGPSGVVSHAIRTGKCILATDRGWIGEVVRKYGNGSTYSPDDSVGFSRALAGVLENHSREYCEEYRDQFLRFNNDTNFVKVIMDSVEELL